MVVTSLFSNMLCSIYIQSYCTSEECNHDIVHRCVASASNCLHTPVHCCTAGCLATFAGQEDEPLQHSSNNNSFCGAASVMVVRHLGKSLNRIYSRGGTCMVFVVVSSGVFCECMYVHVFPSVSRTTLTWYC